MSLPPAVTVPMELWKAMGRRDAVGRTRHVVARIEMPAKPGLHPLRAVPDHHGVLSRSAG